MRTTAITQPLKSGQGSACLHCFDYRRSGSSSDVSSSELAAGFLVGTVADGLEAFNFAAAAADFAQPEHFAGRAEFAVADFFGVAAGALPATKYFRILSRRFLPMPRIASKSSRLLNGPYNLRICKILPAVAGPIPGTCCSSELAALMLIGCSGGFFVVAAIVPPVNKKETQSHKATRVAKLVRDDDSLT